MDLFAKDMSCAIKIVQLCLNKAKLFCLSLVIECQEKQNNKMLTLTKNFVHSLVFNYTLFL